MKTLFLTAAILLLANSNNTAQDWEHYYGQDNVYNIEKDVQEAYDKGYLLLGRISYEDNDDWIQPSWIIKTDINGNLIWDKILKNNDDGVFVNAIDQCNDGGMVVCGSLRINNISYPFIVKLNACGEKEWCRRIPGALNDLPWAEDVKELPNGEIIMLVNMYGDNPNETMHLFKFDANGSMLWQQAYCSGFEYDASALPFGQSITLISGNRILISGEVYWEHPWEPGSGDKWLRPMFVLVDSIGEEEWVLPFGLQDTIVGQGHHSLQIANNTIYGVGRVVGQNINRLGLLMSYDMNGNEIQHNIINFNDINPDFKVGLFWDIKKIDSLYLLAAFVGLEEGSTTPAPPAEFVFKGDESFFSDYQIVNYLHHTEMGEPFCIKKTFNEKILSNSTFKEPYNWNIYLTKLNKDLEQDSIYSGSYTYDSLCPEPILSGFITLNDCFMTDIGEIPAPREYYAHIATIPIKAYPNPVSEGNITFEFENTEHHNNIELKCFDLYGKEIFSEKVYRYQTETVVDITKLKQGMYVTVVYSDGWPVGECKFVVQ